MATDLQNFPLLVNAFSENKFLLNFYTVLEKVIQNFLFVKKLSIFQGVN